MRVERSVDAHDVIVHVSGIISAKLNEGKSVLFMVSGGSSILVAVGVAQQLVTKENLSRLRIMLTDERFGPVGHKDSNWQRLHEAGFALPGAKLIPVLRDIPFDETVRQYERELGLNLRESDFRIGLFGMGADGHTAGILPQSTAVHEKTFAHGYDAEPFTRITMTIPAIAQLDYAFLYVMGKEKTKAMRDLINDKEVALQPAQALKQVQNLTVFTDAL